MGLEDHDWVGDAFDLKDIVGLAPDFNTLMEVDTFFDKNSDYFLTISQAEVLKNPKGVNVRLLEATNFLNRASQSLANIEASDLRFSEKYLKPYREKLNTSLDQFRRGQMRLLEKVMPILESESLAARYVQKTYNISDEDVEDLLDLKSNLDVFHDGLIGFEKSFDGIVKPHMMGPACNNSILSQFMIRQDHEDIFKMVYQWIEDTDFEEAGVGDYYELANRLGPPGIQMKKL